jgi:hypothetical protein
MLLYQIDMIIIKSRSKTHKFGGQSHSYVTQTYTIPHKQIPTDYINESTESKMLLKQSIIKPKLISKMIIEQNFLLKQQTQQITAMLYPTINTLMHKKRKEDWG